MNNDTILVNYYEIDGNDYIVVNKVVYKNAQYVYLVNEKNEKDLLVRKIINDVLEPLDSEEELVNVLKLLVK